jgi:hypothetical protein
VRSPRFRRDPFVRDVASDPGRASAPRIAAPHMLPSAVATASAPAISSLSWLNPTPHTITVYASPWSSPSTTQHSLPSGGYPLLGPDFRRLDRASFLAHRYSLMDSHHLLLAGLPAHSPEQRTSSDRPVWSVSCQTQACAVKHQAALLLRRLCWNEPHVGSGHRLANRFCVSHVVLKPAASIARYGQVPKSIRSATG